MRRVEGHDVGAEFRGLHVVKELEGLLPLAAALGACVDRRAEGHDVGADFRALHVAEELEGLFALALGTCVGSPT